jgi:hypothetical protein
MVLGVGENGGNLINFHGQINYSYMGVLGGHRGGGLKLDS